MAFSLPAKKVDLICAMLNLKCYYYAVGLNNSLLKLNLLCQLTLIVSLLLGIAYDEIILNR